VSSAVKADRWLFLLVALLLALALLPLRRPDAPELQWLRDPETAFSEARTKQQTVVTFLYTDWCTYCRQMDRTTFSDPGLIEQLGDRFVWLRLNAENDAAGRRMALERRITGYPTVIFFDADGREITRLPGYLPPERFQSTLELLLDTTSETSGGRDRDGGRS